MFLYGYTSLLISIAFPTIEILRYIRFTVCIILKFNLLYFSSPDLSNVFKLRDMTQNYSLLLTSAPRARARAHTHTHTHLTMNIICGHIYQTFIITTHYSIIFHHFNIS